MPDPIKRKPSIHWYSCWHMKNHKNTKGCHKWKINQESGYWLIICPPCSYSKGVVSLFCKWWHWGSWSGKAGQGQSSRDQRSLPSPLRLTCTLLQSTATLKLLVLHSPVACAYVRVSRAESGVPKPTFHLPEELLILGTLPKAHIHRYLEGTENTAKECEP